LQVTIDQDYPLIDHVLLGFELNLYGFKHFNTLNDVP
jgi:hypothetical protein